MSKCYTISYGFTKSKEELLAIIAKKDAEIERLREALRDIKLFIEEKYYNVALRIIEKALKEVKE